jgi:hypothetical protein
MALRSNIEKFINWDSNRLLNSLISQLINENNK